MKIDGTMPKDQRITIAAEYIFSKHGFEGATLDEIIELADVGKGIVYKYFGNKEQLFYHIVSEKNDVFVANLSEAVNKAGTMEEKLRAFFTEMLFFYRYNSSLWQIICFEMLNSTNCLIRNIDGVPQVYSRYTSEPDEKTKERMLRYYSLVASEFSILYNILLEGVKQGLLKETDVESSTLYHFFGVVMSVFHADEERKSMDISKGVDIVVDRLLYGAASERMSGK